MFKRFNSISRKVSAVNPDDSNHHGSGSGGTAFRLKAKEPGSDSIEKLESSKDSDNVSASQISLAPPLRTQPPPNNSNSNPLSELSETQINEMFESMLDSMGIDEAKRTQMAVIPFDAKCRMIQANLQKENKDQKTRQDGKTDKKSPEWFVKTCLSHANDKSLPDLKFLTSLRISVTNQPITWVQKFLELKGLEHLTRILETFHKKAATTQKLDWSIETEIIKTIKSMINNKCGIINAFNYPPALVNIALSIDSPVFSTRRLVLEILSVFCYVDAPKGHKLVLDVMSEVGKIRASQRRFEIVMKSLEEHVDTLPHQQQSGNWTGSQNSLMVANAPSTEKEKVDFYIAGMLFINAIVSTPEEIEVRMVLRNDFGFGFKNVIQRFKSIENDVLRRQIEGFESDLESDFEELILGWKSNTKDMSDPTEVFEVCLNSIQAAKESFPYFLNVLHKFLLIKQTDTYVAAKYWHLIDTIIGQVLLDGKGLHPDFTDVYQVNVKSLLEGFITQDRLRSAEETAEDAIQKMNVAFKEKCDLELAIAEQFKSYKLLQETSKAEMEECLKLADGVIKSLQEKLETLSKSKDIRASAATAVDEPAQRTLENDLNKLLEIKTSFKPAPPAPPAIPSIDAALKDATIARPPPLPGPPGGPPSMPPPPPPGQSMLKPVVPMKKLPVIPSCKMKVLNWDKLPDSVIKPTIWSNLDDAKWVNAINLHRLDSLFAAKTTNATAVSNTPKSINDNNKSTKINEITLLEPKRAYGITIMLGRLKITNIELRQAVLKLDESIISENLVRQFIAYVPTAEDINLFQSFKDDPANLSKADQFIWEMIKIPRYEQHLKAMIFRYSYNERLSNVQQDIKYVMNASKGLVESTSLKKLLEIILLLGNYLNNGCVRGAAYGFKISSLKKLVDLKSTDNKTNLMTFLVGECEDKQPDIGKFIDDLNDVTNACKVSFQSIEAEISDMRQSVAEIETELTTQTFTVEDCYGTIMSAYKSNVEADLQHITESYEEMKSKFKEAACMFGEDPEKALPDDFFGVFKSFIFLYEKAKVDAQREKERQAILEKKRQVEAAKMRKEKTNEKKKTTLKGNTLNVSVNDFADDQKGVMDSLLESLKNGDKKNRKQRKDSESSIKSIEKSKDEPHSIKKSKDNQHSSAISVTDKALEMLNSLNSS